MVYHSVGCVVHILRGKNFLTRGQFYSSIWREPFTIVGVFNGEGPPVPIPNTEVKLTSADNTCLETDREDRSMPTQKTAVVRLRSFAVYCMVIWAQFS